jgi:hypothetical protein
VVTFLRKILVIGQVFFERISVPKQCSEKVLMLFVCVCVCLFFSFFRYIYTSSAVCYKFPLHPHHQNILVTPVVDPLFNEVHSISAEDTFVSPFLFGYVMTLSVMGLYSVG